MAAVVASGETVLWPFMKWNARPLVPGVEFWQASSDQAKVT